MKCYTMRKIVMAILLVATITSSAYAVNIFDRVFYRAVFLEYIHQYILVHRLTDTVEYTLGQDRKWVALSEALKTRYQSMYEAQVGK